MALSELLDKCTDLDDLIRVKANGRLVKDQYRRIVDECLCEADSLFIAL